MMRLQLFDLDKSYSVIADPKIETNDDTNIIGMFTKLVLMYHGREVTFHRIPGTVTGIIRHGQGFLCLTQEMQWNDNDRTARITLRQLDQFLREESAQELFCEKGSDTLLGDVVSTLDDHAVYIAAEHGYSGIVTGDGQSFDVLCSVTFTRVDIETGEKNQWEQEEFPHEEVFRGYAIELSRLRIQNGKLLLECNVFDPDNLPIWESPEDAPSPEDPDFAEMCASLEEVEIDFDAQEIKR